MKLTNLRLSRYASPSGRVVAPAVVLAGLAVLAPALVLVSAAPASAAGEFGAAIDRFWALVSEEFEQTPAIVVAVALALIIPPLAIFGLLVRGRGRKPEVLVAPSPKSIPISGFNARGLLIIANSRGEVHEVGHGLVRIGREMDNDVQLVHKTVHRYHAIVERTADAEFYITDVSGDGGNGVRVDGEKIARARLRGNELIEVGRARLRFQLAAADQLAVN